VIGLTLLPLLGFALQMAADPARIENTGWRVWNHREAAATLAYVDNIITRSVHDAIAVSGNSNLAVHGGWEYHVADIKPGAWYRFTAYYKTQGVEHPTWQVLPRIDWRNAAGKRASEPAYVYETKPDGEWTKTWLLMQAPQEASAAVLQLYLSNAPGGTIWWDDVSFEAASAPPDRKIKVATINLRPAGLKSREANVEAFINAANQAAPGKLDVLLFPEGMTVVGTGISYVNIAEPIPGPTTRRLGELARERNSYVVAGIYESEGTAIYNTAILLDRQGRLAGKYRKVYLPREEYESGLTPGNSFPVFETDFGRVGLMICYDVFFNHPAQALANKGAEVILLPIWGGDETLAKARAIEHRIFLVTSGYDHPTYIMDPYGERISEARERGTAAIATLDLNRKYRDKWLGDMRERRAKEARTDVPLR